MSKEERKAWRDLVRAMAKRKRARPDACAWDQFDRGLSNDVALRAAMVSKRSRGRVTRNLAEEVAGTFLRDWKWLGGIWLRQSEPDFDEVLSLWCEGCPERSDLLFQAGFGRTWDDVVEDWVEDRSGAIRLMRRLGHRPFLVGFGELAL